MVYDSTTCSLNINHDYAIVNLPQLVPNQMEFSRSNNNNNNNNNNITRTTTPPSSNKITPHSTLPIIDDHFQIPKALPHLVQQPDSLINDGDDNIPDESDDDYNHDANLFLVDDNDNDDILLLSDDYTFPISSSSSINSPISHQQPHYQQQDFILPSQPHQSQTQLPLLPHNQLGWSITSAYSDIRVPNIVPFYPTFGTGLGDESPMMMFQNENATLMPGIFVLSNSQTFSSNHNNFIRQQHLQEQQHQHQHQSNDTDDLFFPLQNQNLNSSTPNLNQNFQTIGSIPPSPSSSSLPLHQRQLQLQHPPQTQSTAILFNLDDSNSHNNHSNLPHTTHNDNNGNMNAQTSSSMHNNTDQNQTLQFPLFGTNMSNGSFNTPASLTLETLGTSEISGPQFFNNFNPILNNFHHNNGGNNLNNSDSDNFSLTNPPQSFSTLFSPPSTNFHTEITMLYHNNTSNPLNDSGSGNLGFSGSVVQHGGSNQLFPQGQLTYTSSLNTTSSLNPYFRQQQQQQQQQDQTQHQSMLSLDCPLDADNEFICMMIPDNELESHSPTTHTSPPSAPQSPVFEPTMTTTTTTTTFTTSMSPLVPRAATKRPVAKKMESKNIANKNLHFNQHHDQQTDHHYNQDEENNSESISKSKSKSKSKPKSNAKSSLSVEERQAEKEAIKKSKLAEKALLKEQKKHTGKNGNATSRQVKEARESKESTIFLPKGQLTPKVSGDSPNSTLPTQPTPPPTPLARGRGQHVRSHSSTTSSSSLVEMRDCDNISNENSNNMDHDNGSLSLIQPLFDSEYLDTFRLGQSLMSTDMGGNMVGNMGDMHGGDDIDYNNHDNDTKQGQNNRRTSARAAAAAGTKRLLNSDDDSDDNYDEKQKYREKNRVSAQKSRQRKRDQQQREQQDYERCKTENVTLKNKIEFLEQQLQMLRSHQHQQQQQQPQQEQEQKK